MAKKIVFKKKINYQDFYKFLKRKIEKKIKKQITNKRLVYRIPSSKEKDLILKDIINKIFLSNLRKSGPKNKEIWEKGWGQNLNDYKKKKSFEKLLPKYFKKSKVARLHGEPIITKNKSFDHKVLDILIMTITSIYLKNYKNLFYFGCGTGYNLKSLRYINNKCKIIGFDWASSSHKILSFLKKNDRNLYFQKFNFFNPKFLKEASNISKKDPWAALTIASLEQVGKNHSKFVKFLLKKKPSVVVNIEPIIEFGDDTNLFDHLSKLYCYKRNYLQEYYTYLDYLEKNGKIKIIFKNNSSFGSKYINGYSLIVWKLIR